jgi:hypothetical protein
MEQRKPTVRARSANVAIANILAFSDEWRLNPLWARRHRTRNLQELRWEKGPQQQKEPLWSDWWRETPFDPQIENIEARLGHSFKGTGRRGRSIGNGRKVLKKVRQLIKGYGPRATWEHISSSDSIASQVPPRALANVVKPHQCAQKF